MKKILPALILMLILLSPFGIDIGLKQDFASAYYNASGAWNIAGETIWSADMGTIVINWRSVVVQPGAKLVIGPGTVVKAGSLLGIWVYGELEIRGTEDNPAVITSYCDNEYGNTGIICPPERDKNIFGGIRTMEGGRTAINHALIRYGGEMAPINTLSRSSVNAAIAGYGYEIYGALSVHNGTLSVTNSKIEKSLLGIGTTGSVCHAAIGESSISGNQFGAKGECGGNLQASGNWWGSITGPWHEIQNPQGLGDKIAGSVDFDPWQGKPRSDDPVLLIPGMMGSWNISGRWELDPIFHTYDDLWQALQSAGYETGKTLFAFPYQWRLSNVHTAILLKEKIDEIKAICECGKVDLVAHSMGGLAARAYVQGGDYGNDVDQLIFLVTPQKGAVGAYLMWEGGEMGQDMKDEIMEKIFRLEAEFNGYNSLFSYARGLPMQSVQELLPIYDYLREDGGMRMRKYPENYPANTFLELLNQAAQVGRLSNVRAINIIADAGPDSTVNSLRVVASDQIGGRWEHGYPESYGIPLTDHGLEYGPGDETVPLASNSQVGQARNITLAGSHSGIVAGAQKAVIKELTGSEPAIEIRSNFFKKALLIRIFSPADFMVTAPDGKQIGYGGAGGIADEIDNAFYYNQGYEFALIPDPLDGEYRISLTGTGRGSYKLSTSLISAERSADFEYSGEINNAEEQILLLNIISAAEEDCLTVSPDDHAPPRITISQPVDSQNYRHDQAIRVDYEAIDDFSGIDKVGSSLDGIPVEAESIDPLNLDYGAHLFKVEAWDKEGNYAAQTAEFNLVTDVDGLIGEIDKIYGLGLITKEHVKKNLIKMLFGLKLICNKFASAPAWLSGGENIAVKLYLIGVENYVKAFYRINVIKPEGYAIIGKAIAYLKAAL